MQGARAHAKPPDQPCGVAVTYTLQLNKKDDWETPPDTFEWACRVTGIDPVLDVCATAENTKCGKYYTVEDNALRQDWKDAFWMNPPYSNVDMWIRKAVEESNLWGTHGLALVFAKVDTKWFHDVIYPVHELYFPRGRVKFLDGGKERQSAPYPSMLIHIAPSEDWPTGPGEPGL